MKASLAVALERVLGSPVRSLRQVSGGDVNLAFRCELEDGRHVFAKTHPEAAPGVFVREAEGLRWLADGGARVPAVLAACEDPDPPLLALSWIDTGPRREEFDRELGSMLARLHESRAPCFGWARDNFIGPLVQPNASRTSWHVFYGEQRLLPMAQEARRRGALTSTQLDDIQRLVPRLKDLVGPEEPPARLHGDLWSGNVMADAQGMPVLIDPACYGGHREIDLAMLSLFGRVSAELLSAYDAIYPRAPGSSERVPLYQLYPLLVHAALFGGGYGPQAAATARRYL